VTQSFDLPYFPRGSLVEEVLQILTSGLKQGVTLFAPRRQGKTSFVRHAGRHGEYEIEDRATLLQLRSINADQ
jgi:hypothetical protein